MNGLRRHIEFVSVAVEPLPDERRHARVELWRPGRGPGSGDKFVGNAEAPDPLRAAAEATLDALRRAFPEGTKAVQGVNAVQTFEALSATIVGVSVSVYHGGELRLTLGFARVRGYDAATAAARAVLDATNRLLK